MGDWKEQPFALLLRVTQLNGKPIPIGEFTGRVMSQMPNEVSGVVPKEVVIMNDPRSSDGVGGRNFYNGGFKGNTWIGPLGWTIY